MLKNVTFFNTTSGKSGMQPQFIVIPTIVLMEHAFFIAWLSFVVEVKTKIKVNELK